MSQLRQIALKNQNDESEDQPKKLTSMQMVMYWLIAFVVFYTLYIAQTLFLPVVVAALFALLLSPLVGVLKRFYIPRSFSALLLLASLGVPFTLLGMQLVEPAERWAERIPELSTQLTTELNEISEKLALSEQAPPPKAEPEEDSGGWFGWFSKDEPEPPKPEPEPDQ
ncbi:MAG: AI-2E family transporter, partial [Pseudomonadota bacterium]|nr:AI-2E family transporter [Pseudomonadota bacterium]